jgi:large subunit ribosomal protein L10
MFCKLQTFRQSLLKKKLKDGIPSLKAAYAEEGFYIGADQLDALASLKSKE